MTSFIILFSWGSGANPWGDEKDDRYDGQEERKTLTWTGNGEQAAMVSWAWVEILSLLKTKVETG